MASSGKRIKIKMMTIISVALLLCSWVSMSSAGCCTPDQWEGGEGTLSGWAGHRKHGIIVESVRVSYDYTNKRSAAFLNYRNGEYENKFRIVTRFEDEEGKIYVVDLKKDKCWTKKLEGEFRKACVPDKAKEVGDYYMGLKGGFKVTGYFVEGERLHAYLTVKKVDGGQCIPVAEGVFGQLKRVGFVASVGFTDLTAGIKNETVFDIPSECEERQDVTLAEELTREHYILAV